MSYTYHGASNLIPLPGRSVQTYPSGLVRVERSFICRKNNANLYRERFKVGNLMPDDDGAPAIDGLYIFPEPQEAVRDDGFVEFRVTAYGRTNIFSEISIVRSTSTSTVLKVSRTIEGLQGVAVPAIVENYLIRGVLLSSDASSVILSKPQIENPIILISPDFDTPLKPGDNQFVNSSLSQNIQIGIFLDGYSSVNYGVWSEYFVNWKANATITSVT